MCPWQRGSKAKLELPQNFLCPISLVIMEGEFLLFIYYKAY